MANGDQTKGQIHTKDDQPAGIKSGTNHLLAIGINKYQHWSNLNNAVKDVQDIVKLLQEEYQFAEDNTTILLDEAATEDNIVAALEGLTNPNTVKPEDNVLIYYSGHGHMIERSNDKKRGFWVPIDAEKGQTADYLRNSAIREYIEDIPAKHLLLISDACFSGSLLVRGAVRSDASLQELQKRRSRWGLCSGRADEVVADGQPGENSPFAKAIMEELKSNKSPQLNVQKLAVKVVDMTRRNYKQLPEGAPIYGVGDNGGQFIFERKQDEAAIWQSTLPENTIAGFEAYIAAFPGGQFVKEARNRISTLQEEEAWNKAVHSNSINAYNKYLLVYPEGFYRNDAMTAIQKLEDDTAWEKAVRSNRLSAFHAYLRDFPQGTHIQEARQRIENSGQGKGTSSSPTYQQDVAAKGSKGIGKKIVLGVIILGVAIALIIWGTQGKKSSPASAAPLELSAQIDGKKIVANIQNADPPIKLTLSRNGREVLAMALQAPGAHLIDISPLWQEDYGRYALAITDHSGRRAESSVTISSAPPKITAQEGETIIASVSLGEAPYALELSKNGTTKYEYTLTRPGQHSINVLDAWKNDPGKYSLKVTDKKDRSAETTVQINRGKPVLPDDVRQVLYDIELNLVDVPGGTFTMGCQSGRDGNCKSRELPPRSVNIADFKISKYELTQKKWETIMGNNPSTSNKNSSQYPVESISWNDIQVFIQRLNELSGKNYRLPSEAEWEYAARGGNKSKGFKYAGTNTLDQVSWHGNNSGQKTHPVGKKAANELKLFDMNGNVWEWVQDCWHGSFNGAPNDGSPWESGSCPTRVLRGESWFDTGDRCRVVYRDGISLTSKLPSGGFRLAHD